MPRLRRQRPRSRRGVPPQNPRPTSQYLPRGTAEPFPKNMSPMSCDSDPAFRLTVPPRCRCGGLSSSISRTTMKPRCASASRICAITSNRFRRNERQGAWRQLSRTGERRTRVAIPQASQMVAAGFRSAHWNRLDKLRVSAAIPC